jgi:glycerol-3-phosphate dehydrogenase
VNRDKSLGQLREARDWDVLVIGGGATGLGAALDAATRGYRTALVEQSDFAKATSSRSTKLIHGGVRYLRQGNLSLVRGALHERTRLLANAPDLVHPLAFIIPAESRGQTLFYGAGLKLYDLLAGSHGLSPSQFLSREEVLARAPTLQNMRLRGGLLYYDAQFDDARLAIALAQTFAQYGGAPVNYARVVALRKSSGKIRGALVRDEESGAEIEIAARVVINATGVFSDALRRLDEPGAEVSVTPSQGAHLVLPKRFLPSETAILLPNTSDGRVLFAIPWHDRVLLGTTDVPVHAAALDPHPLAEEVEFLIDHAHRHLGWTIGTEDIVSAYAGLRPLVRKAGARHTSQLSRDHVVTISEAGLVTIAGGKWTTYRKMAEDAVDAAAKVASLQPRECKTADLRLARLGSDVEPNDDLLHPRLPYRQLDVLRAIRDEMARTVEDVLSRRLRALYLDARACREIAPTVAALLARELHRDDAWQREQVTQFGKECEAALPAI